MATDDPRSIEAALAWAKWVLSVEQDQRKDEEDALRFQDAEGAWPEDVKQLRGSATVAGVPVPARPMISVATLDEPIALQSSFERQANLAPRIHALSEDANDDTAEVLAGIYRSIERDSRAQLARRWSYDRTIWAGRGAYRVDCEYDPQGGHALDQKIVIKRILYQSNVLFDPTAQEPDWSDGLRAMVLYDLPWRTYLRRYGKSQLAKAEASELTELQTHEDTSSWIRAGESDPQTRMIRVAEDWLIDIERIPQVLLDDNSVSPADAIPKGRKKHPTDTRKVPDKEVRHVYWRTMNAVENLDDWQEWDGQYIPLIPATGRELQPVQGKRRWFGMVQNAKGAVRLTNYAASGAVEKAALEPKAPWKAPEGAFEGHEGAWQQANVRNIPYLYYKNTDLTGRPIAAADIQRVQADMTGVSINMQLLSMGQGFVQSATATHPPALGQDTPAFRSGKAINALQTQSVQANAPYLDNLADISMTYEAKVILDLIPKKYDRPGRIARCLGIDGKTNTVALNQPFIPPQNGGRPQLLPYGTDEEQSTANALVADPNHPAKHYDLSKGRYGVEVSIGKSYADERQEGMTEMGAILQADPQFMQLIGPEYFHYRGEPWAEQVATILEKNREHTMPWLSSNGQQPNAQQMQQLMAENQQLKAAMQQAALEKAGKVVEQQGKANVAQIQESAETERAREANEVKLAVATLQGKFETLQNAMQLFFEERARVGEQAHDVGLGAAEAQASSTQSAQEHAQAMAQAQQGAVNQAALSEQTQGQALEQNTQQASLAPPQQANGAPTGQGG